MIDDVRTSTINAQNTPFLNSLNRLHRFLAGVNCSNARALYTTGVYSIRPQNLVGGIFNDPTGPSLPVGPHLICQQIPGSVHIGKHHLSALTNYLHRTQMRYVFHAGSQANLEDYYTWLSSYNGIPVIINQYATDWTADKAINCANLGYNHIDIAFNAVHHPYHYPPGVTEGDMEIEMLKHLDSALCRLVPVLEALGYAIIIFSDNGGTVASGGKGNLSHETLATYCAYIGFTPISRPVVELVDIYATVIHLNTGMPPVFGDGISLVDASQLKQYAFSDEFSKVLEPPGPGWKEMVTDGYHKLIRKPSTREVWTMDWFDNPLAFDTTDLIEALNQRDSQ